MLKLKQTKQTFVVSSTYVAIILMSRKAQKSVL